MSVSAPTNTANFQFSPVLQPLSAAGFTGHQNLTGLPKLTKDIVADLHKKIQKWSEYHINGAILVKKIALKKADAMEQFPEGLDNMMKHLADIYKKLELCVESLTFLAGQMASMVTLNSGVGPLFFSMSPAQFNKTISEIAKAYASELMRKEYVVLNIARSRSKHEAMFHAACWVHPQYITNGIKAKLEIILVETGLRTIS